MEEQPKMLTRAGRNGANPQSKNLKNSTQYEPTKVPVFNRTGGVLGYSEPGYPYIQIPAGRWTTEGENKKPLPRSFVQTYLRKDPNISVLDPYAKYFATDERFLTIGAPLDPITGWGRSTTHIIQELAKLRATGAPKPRDWSMPQDDSNLLLFPISYWRHEELPDEVEWLTRKPHHPTKWGLAMTIPSEFPNMPCRNLVALSMWETSSLPKDWYPLFKNVKHLIVPSESQVEIFRQGYDGAISVVPLGVDTDVYGYYERPQRGEKEPFTIVVVGSPLTSRKSPMESLYEVCWRSFSGLYGEPVDDWKLILKTRKGILGGGQYFEINDSHVEVISADYTDTELADLYHRADVGMCLSKFEGFGLVSLEMEATGLPVILSNNSGHTDRCDVNYNIPVISNGESPASDGYGDAGWHWYELDWQYAATVLRQEYENWKRRGKTQSGLGKRAAQRARTDYTWVQSAKKIDALLTKLTGI